MKKQMKLLFTILFSCTITSVCAQLQQGQLMNIKFSTTKPIQKGDSVTIVVEWDPQYISTIIFENVYTPTKEEVNKRKFTLVVKPQKTTTYQITRIYTEWKPNTLPHTIKVLDENGVEIKEDKTEQKENAMKKYIIPLLIVLLCSIIVGGYYQLKKIGITNMSLNKDKPSIQKGDSVNITTQIVSEKKLMEIKYSNREPIQKGDSVTFHVTWDTLYISNIIFKDVYSPTKEEMKNGMYTLVVHPEKTTTYQIQKDYTTGESRILPHEVKVLDEHGIEIK